VTNKLIDKLRMESNEDRSGVGDSAVRIVNALGSIGFGFTIGGTMMSWLPVPTIFQQVLGAVFVAIIFDFALMFWEARTELQSGSTKQNKISKEAVTISLGASTIASVAFMLLQMLPFIFQGPENASRLSGIEFNVRMILSFATAGVMAYQFVRNTNWLSQNPDKQRDRQKAESYSTLSDQMVEIEGDILEKVPNVMREKTQAHINNVVEEIAKEKSDEIIRRMGYGQFVDGQNTGPSNADLLALIKQLQGDLNTGKEPRVNILDMWKPSQNGNPSGD
jgi:hypothetical protein